MTHIMIDLETLGTDPVEAPIIQIGAVAFELEDDGPSDAYPYFRVMVDAQSCLVPPFTRIISPDTVAWWADTDPELLVRLMRERGGHPLAEALAELGLWIMQIDDGIEGVWSNGATFDISMLEAAYKQAGLRTPWHFRTVRDVRTMVMIAGNDERCWEGGTITETEAKGIKHDALVDCLRQVRVMQQTWKLRVKQDEMADDA
jgi:hypothetical protein